MTLLDQPAARWTPTLPDGDPDRSRSTERDIKVTYQSGHGPAVRVLSGSPAQSLEYSGWFRFVVTNARPLLLSLRPGWNSHGAPTIDVRAVECGIAALVELLHDDTKPPAMFPTASGGVNFEWTTTRFALGLMSEPGVSPILSYEGDDGEWDGPPQDAPTYVLDALKALASD